MKKVFKATTLLFFFSLTISFANTGPGEIEANKRIRTEAEAYFENHQYSEALTLYLQLQGKTVDKGVIDYMIGMCYLSTEEKYKALEFLIKAKESKETSFVINYYLGKVYFDAGHYNKAVNYLSVYLKDLNSFEGIYFKPYKNVPKEHLVHYQKSSRDVNQMLDFCSAQLKEGL